MANWLARVMPWRSRSQVPCSTEGAYRPGPYLLADGWLSATAGRFINFWQMGYNVCPYGSSSAMVEACISAYAQTIAMCPGDHWETTPDGGRKRITTSALSRILRQPNDYQSISDLLLNLVRRLYENGESFAVAIRNNRGEVQELHLMKYGYPYIGEDGSIFYSLQGNEIIERRFNFGAPIPARDVLHIRLHTPRHALKGESPILATVLERAMAGAALNHQVTFYINQARPSFMLETDLTLNREQIEALRTQWNEQTTGDNVGNTPILAWGLKAKPVSVSPADSALAEMLKITDQSIALAFRMPLQVLGVGDTPFASTEALMSSWKASGLGFALNHIEEAFGRLFGLKGQPEEYLELDTDALMRSNFKDQIEALARSVTSGIHSPDEARNKQGLPSVPGGVGKEPRVQQQVVPLSFGSDFENLKSKPAALPAPEKDKEEDDGTPRGFDDYARQIDDLADRHAQTVH